MTTPTPKQPADPLALLRTRGYLVLLVFAAILGVPISAVAYCFLSSSLSEGVFTDLPSGLGFDGEPLWWPLLPLALAGVLVALTIRYLPGRAATPRPTVSRPGRHHPGPAARHRPRRRGHAVARRRARPGSAAHRPRRRPGRPGSALVQARRAGPGAAVVGAAGSFAAIATLLGSPLLGAFLLMEVAGLGGAMLDIVLLPGLLAAGIGALIFIGLDAWTGFGTFSLAIPTCRRLDTPIRPVRLGARDRPRGRDHRHGHPPARPVRASARRTPPVLYPGRRAGLAGLAILYAAGDRAGCIRRAVLRAVRARRPDRPSAPATPSGRCCCWCARAWPTGCR